MTTPLSLVTRQARLLALRDMIDQGGGRIEFYDGIAEPASPETTHYDTLLGFISLAQPCGVIGSSDGLASLTITPCEGDAVWTGIVAWARFINGNNVAILDRPVFLVGNTGPIIVSDLHVYAGGELQLVSCVISE